MIETNNVTIDIQRWKQMLIKLEIFAVIIVFLIEAADNAILYITRSQGYGPETIADKLFRYLFLTTLVNVSALLITHIFCKIFDEYFIPFILINGLVCMAANVAISHYQFGICMATFVFPIVISIVFENFKVLNHSYGLSMLFLIVALTFRGNDNAYNNDIISESVIAIFFISAVYYFGRIMISIMRNRREVLLSALEYEQKSKYADALNIERDAFKHLSEETFVAISNAVDVNDSYTAGHSQRVANYSREIARRMNLGKDDVWEIYYAGLLHDVGKLGIDNSIINKPDKLSDDEYNEIKRHPMMGYNILKGISIKGQFALGAKCHHERWDGRGYPEGLEGMEIPLIGRIIAVADAYDAMTSKRAYRPIMAQESVRHEIETGAGSQFDPGIAKIMLSMIDEDVDYKMHQ